jgi:threonine/homoserine/homoserine lactone efflux protein
MSLLLFELAVIAVLAVPGPTNALLFTAAALGGLGRAPGLVAAVCAGYGVSIGALTMLGEAAIAGDPRIGLALRLLLAAYLALLAWRLWRMAAQAQEAEGGPITTLRVLIATLLNPKALVLAFAVFPRPGSLGDALLHGGAFLATAAIVALGWIAVGAWVGRQGGAVPRLLPRLAALGLGAFAAFLAGAALAPRL